MTHGNGWYAIEAFIDYARSWGYPELYLVSLSVPGRLPNLWYAVMDDFGTLVEVLP